jgi:hypothetical protein
MSLLPPDRWDHNAEFAENKWPVSIQRLTGNDFRIVEGEAIVCPNPECPIAIEMRALSGGRGDAED